MGIIYYRWAYSPTTGDATIAHNHEGHPTDIRFHSDMAEERPENDLLFGFANRTETGWKITSDDSREIDDPHLIEAVERAIERDESQRKAYVHKDTPETFWERMRLVHGEDIDQESAKRRDSDVPDNGSGGV